MLVGNWPWPMGFSFGLVKERPVAIDGSVVARPTMMLSMSFDRRLMAGAPAARFFSAVGECLKNAETRLH
jgi:pyruvate/2-oxoglutarate dehydrogenase complex dihydrolipoamide acyltransferase (E2) component